MIKNLRLDLVLIISIVATLSGMAQMRHVNNTDPYARAKASVVEVYELEYVDVQPEFPGGEHGLINFINDTRVYPYEAYKRRIQGRVLCSFVVGTDGRVSNICVIRGTSDETLNREAVRVISEMPRWKAGRIGRNAVPVRVVLPVSFRL